jgi:hypothetical protein
MNRLRSLTAVAFVLAFAACGGKTDDTLGSTNGGAAAGGSGGGSAGSGGASTCPGPAPLCKACDFAPTPATCGPKGWECPMILDCPPPPLPTCTKAGDCPQGLACHFPSGSCAGPGFCQPAPTACDELYSPHCGCFTGKPYDNECFAYAAGEPSFACGPGGAGGGGGSGGKGGSAGAAGGAGGSTGGTGGSTGGAGGAPPKTCGGLLGVPCAPNQYCDYGPYQCPGPDQPGVCLDKPTSCPKNYDVVCGCTSGAMFDNPCFAHMAGEDASYCPGTGGAGGGPGSSCGGIAGTPCPTGYYCDFPDKLCGGNDNLGTCISAPPDKCAGDGEVCGCDGKVYPSTCAAELAGVDVSLQGFCKQPSGTFACGTHFCQLADEYCEIQGSDVGGWANGYACRKAPAVCMGAAPHCSCLAGVPCGSFSCSESSTGGASVLCPGG